MVFSSNIFLFFFLPIFLVLYFLTPKKFRNYTLLLFSLVFYAYGAPDFLLLLVGECVVNYYLVNGMVKAKRGKKLFCAASILISLGLLLYFKYAGFIIENLSRLPLLTSHLSSLTSHLQPSCSPSASRFSLSSRSPILWTCIAG